MSNSLEATIELSPMDIVLPPPTIEENEDSPFNIIITNVTSVPPEVFASVPDQNTDKELQESSPVPQLLSNNNSLKRNHPCEEESIEEVAKKARLETHCPSEQNVTTNFESEDTAVLSPSKQSSDKSRYTSNALPVENVRTIFYFLKHDNSIATFMF